jgi:hypothetical protein
VDTTEIAEGFRQELELIAAADPDLLDDVLRREKEERGDLGLNLGRRMAHAAVASARWRRAIGDTVDTTELTRILGVTRQAIHQRVDTAALLAVPGQRSSLYPLWQIDVEAGEIRPAASALWRAWRAIDPETSPLTLAAWAASGSDDLAGASPAELIIVGRRVDDVIALAEVTAGTLAR